jgi:Glycosyltransferase family 87
MASYNFDIKKTQDFRAYYDGAVAFVSGQFPYLEASKSALFGFVYPPPSLVLFAPFAYLPINIGWFVWQLLNIAVFGYATAQLAKALGYSQVNRLNVVLFALFCGPTFASICAAQVNPLLAACVVLALLSFEKRSWLASVLLALAAALKIYPVLIGLLFVSTADRFGFALKCFLFGIALCLIVSLINGWNLLPDYLFGFLPQTLQIDQGSLGNQSLTGVIMRLERPVSIWTDWDAMQFDIGPLAGMLNVAGLLGITLWGALLCARRPTPAVTLAMGLVILAGIPLFSPRGWSNLHVLVIPLLIYGAAGARAGYVRIAAATSGIVLLFPLWSIGPYLTQMPVALAYVVGNSYVLSGLALVFCVLFEASPALHRPASLQIDLQAGPAPTD